jgi:hypothetical protein
MIQNNETNRQNTANTDQEETLATYLSGFDQPEKARAFLDDILIRHNDEQWAVSGLLAMLDTIAEQKSMDDVKIYIAELRVHLFDWKTDQTTEEIN